MIPGFGFLGRVPKTIDELREWLTEADREFRDILTTWADFVPFVYDEDADWIALNAYRYSVAILPHDQTAGWRIPETTKDHRILDALRYVGTYLAACGSPPEGAKPLVEPHVVLPQLLSASDIAKIVGRPRESVTSFLSRYAEAYPDCRVENHDRRSNEPKHLYRTADVWPNLQEWLKRQPGG